MRSAVLHLTICLAAGLAPLVTPRAATPVRVAGAEFPGWAESFDGRPLVVLPPTALDARFLHDLPGRVKRFTDGEREIVVRWSAEPTRFLHPAAVCFHADGWDVTPLPQIVDVAGRAWGRFRATRDRERLEVRERVEDMNGHSWPEPTAWYWASILGRISGPAWAWTVARRE